MGVGIDIGTKSIKIVELDKKRDSYTLRGSGVIGYTGPSLDKITDDAGLVAIAEIMRKLHKEAKISSNDITISLSEEHVYTRIIKFPLLSDQEIASAVKWEAEQYIPIPIADAVVDHQIIERDETATPPVTRVLLLAAPKEVVHGYVQAIQAAGLNVTTVETELLALCRSLAPSSGTHMVVDFGSSSTDMAITRNGKMVFTRSIPTAGNALTRAVAQSLGMDEIQAEQYKKTYGLATDKLEGKVSNALLPVIKMVAEEIKKAVHFYQSEDKGEQPQSVILSGGSSGLVGIIAQLSELLNREVVVGDPFSKVEMDSNIRQSLAAYAPLYSIAAGLAMR